MLKFISICSGSSGNCYYLNADGFGLVIDMGIGIRVFKRHFSNYGLPLAQIKAVLVTHDHTDHVKGVGVLARDFNLPVYTTEAVHSSIMRNHYISKKIPFTQQKHIERGEPFNLGPFEITAFFVPHDSADNNGYIIKAQEKCLVLMTDIGHFTEEMPGIVSQATHLIIEGNYDPYMLEKGPYPQRLKKRISSPIGHISNGETAEFLAQHLNKQRIERVWLCHLSAENNRPALAQSTVTQALQQAGFDLDRQINQLQVEPLPRRTPTNYVDLTND